MNRQELSRRIEAGVSRMGQSLPEGGGEKLAALLFEVERWGARVNLTAMRGLEAMVSGHVLDSLAVRPHVAGPRVADVGTGAGFPGLPIAVAEPCMHVELIDSSAKKIAFVKHIIAELDVGNATAVLSRVENYAPARPFDTVLVRAFAGIPKIVMLAGHLPGDNGKLLALKGKYPHDELQRLSSMKKLAGHWDYEVSELTVPGLEQHARHVVRLGRRKTTAP